MTATVRALWRWPVKAMAGETAPSVRVDGRGVGGDRTHAVLRPAEAGWAVLSALDTAVLRDWSAAYPFNAGANVDPAQPPYAVVTSPDGRRFVWDDPRLRHALEDHLGHEVQLRRDVAGLQLVERTVLLAGGDEDPVRLRANLHLDAAPADLASGLDLVAGGRVRMRILGPCPTGGTYARVLASGRIGVGADVELTPGGSGSGAIGR